GVALANDAIDGTADVGVGQMPLRQRDPFRVMLLEVMDDVVPEVRQVDYEIDQLIDQGRNQQHEQAARQENENAVQQHDRGQPAPMESAFESFDHGSKNQCE